MIFKKILSYLIVLEMVVVMNVISQNPQTFQIPSSWQEFLSKIQQLPAQKKAVFVEAYLQSRTTEIPIIENERATFLFYGAAKTVKIAGDFNGWVPNVEMQRIPGTNLWYYTQSFKNDARLEYKIVKDDEWGLDSLNPKKADGGFGKNSDLWMASYKPTSWLNSPEPENKGTMETINIESDFISSPRRLQVYLPHNYTTEQSYPLLIVHDGNDYIRFANLAILSDLLISQNKIRPFIIAFIDPIDRFQEYECNEKYLQFTQKELVPYLEKNYSVSKNRNERGFAGASMGGLVSFFLAYQMRDSFALAICQSGAFFFDEKERNTRAYTFLNSIDYANLKESKIWLDCGNIGDLEQRLLQYNEILKHKLEESKIPHHYEVINEAHNWTSWRKRLEAALLFIFE